MTFPYEGSPSEPTADFSYSTEDEDTTPVEIDEPELDDDTADEEHDEEATAGKKSNRRKPARPTRLTAAQVRRVLSQADVIDQQEPAVRELLAATLSTNTSTEDLVVATLSASKATEVIDDLLAIANEKDPFKSVVLAAALVGDRDNARRTWAILASLGKVTGSIPAKEVLAGAAVASAAKDLDLDDLAGLSLVTELLG